MRYKTLVAGKLDNINNMLSIIKRGLENRTITAKDVVEKVKQVKATVEDTINLIDKETEGLN